MKLQAEKGRIDWVNVLKAFKKIDYKGSLDIEINIADNPDMVYLKAKEYLEKILEKIKGKSKEVDHTSDD